MTETTSNPQTPQPKKPSVLINFLGSMNLAVTLLMMLSIASVIGTVLKQDQSFQDYIIKFGPFWTEVFNSLGLFHVYGAAWFILVLLFLLLSTSTCVIRNAPIFMKDMKQFSEKMSSTAIKHQPHHETFASTATQAEQQKLALALLKRKGYKTKVHQTEEGAVTVAGMKGQWNRLGYILTHISIIVICIGALLDSNLLLKYREITGDLKPETRAIGLSEIPQQSWLGPENMSFRGSVNVPEEQKTDVLFLPYEDGYLVQKLPFTITNKNFRIEYYDTGMPKSFESDLILTAPDLEKPIETTISVNHPLYYKNYAIYQSSFGDGGSKIKLNVHPLLSPDNNPLPLDMIVSKTESLKTPVGTFKIELNDFRMNNIVPTSEEEQQKTGKKVHNNGPSIIFKVRNDQGKAWEYENYMMPSLQDGRKFFMTGMRESPAEPFRYLFIPADANNKNARFFNFMALLNNPITASEIFSAQFPKTAELSERTYELQIKLLQQLLTLFRQKGFDGINEFVNNNVPENDRKKVSDYYLSQTSFAIQTLYLEVLKAEGRIQDYNQEINDFDKKWFEDVLNTVAAIAQYGPPMYFELTGFTEVQATGLQITKSPGKDVVYFGSAMLIIGVFFLFYVRQRRVWIHIKPAQKQGEEDIDSAELEVTVAAKDNRNLPETKVEFAGFVEQIKQFNQKNVS